MVEHSRASTTLPPPEAYGSMETSTPLPPEQMVESQGDAGGKCDRGLSTPRSPEPAVSPHIEEMDRTATPPPLNIKNEEVNTTSLPPPNIQGEASNIEDDNVETTTLPPSSDEQSESLDSIENSEKTSLDVTNTSWAHEFDDHNREYEDSETHIALGELESHEIVKHILDQEVSLYTSESEVFLPPDEVQRTDNTEHQESEVQYRVVQHTCIDTCKNCQSDQNVNSTIMLNPEHENIRGAEEQTEKVGGREPNLSALKRTRLLTKKVGGREP
ncbi:hypothetical protein JTB14_034617 [Gonioctena quinquepunctata]|nr:hypothetical protein JTB14_034617 [Gonioctena quinquepunctata]